VATTLVANLLVRFAPRARMGRSGPRLLSLDACVTGAARRTVVGSDGSASTACFASMKVKDNCPAREEHMAWGWKQSSTKAERSGA